LIPRLPSIFRAVVFSAPVIVFFPVLDAGFLAWDDDALLLGNSRLRFSFENVLWAFQSFRLGHYMPLTWLTYMADSALWNDQPAGYHLTNLLLHAANAVLFYDVAQRLLRRAAPEVSTASPLGGSLAAAGAAFFFALHPLRAESVAWITQRRDLLAAFFLLLSFRSYLAEDAGRLRRSFLFFLLSLLSKSVGMVFPALLLLVDWYPLRRIGGKSPGWRGSEIRTVLREKLIFLVPALAAALAAAAAQMDTGATASLVQHPGASRLVQAAAGAGFLFAKTLFPFSLSPLYEIPSTLAWTHRLAAGFALLATAGFFLARDKYPGLFAAWMTHLLFWAPTSGVFQSGPQWAADRYTYLGGMGWAVLAGIAISCSWKLTGPRRSTALTMAASILVVTAFLSRAQARVWKSTESLWTHVLSVDPTNAMAHYNLGCLRLENGAWDAARFHFESALTVRPSHAAAVQNLGYVALQKGDHSKALRLFQRALALNPALPESHNNMGLIFWNRGEAERAETHYREAIRLDPDFAEAHNNLAGVLAANGNFTAAAAAAEEALRLNPDSAAAHFNLGHIRRALGELRAARDHFQRAVKLDSSLAERLPD
jgi:protein O-mannosyl-transferase